MIENAAENRRLDWRAPVFSIVVAIIVFFPLVMSENEDLLYLFFVAPGLFIMGLAALIYAAVRKNPRIAAAVVCFWTVSALLFIYASAVRNPVKWLLFSFEYKKEVLAQPVPSNGDFKHLEWDSWGWAGAYSSAYLVFDQADSLALAAKSHQSGKFNGIPCKVPWVSRVQSRWYIVTFYTDEVWGRCSV